MRRLTDRWKQDPEYKAAYDALESEFALAKAMILARTSAHLTQTQLAEKMGTNQGSVSKWESGTDSPTVETLRRVADATGTELIVKFKRLRRPANAEVPARARRRPQEEAPAKAKKRSSPTQVTA